MKTETIKHDSIGSYISNCPIDAQTVLNELYHSIKDIIPEAQEKISWGMPTFYLKGNLIHFAAHKRHIGLYPGGEAIIFFCERLQAYKTSKGAIQLPMDQPLPIDLISDIVLFNKKRMGNLEK